MLNAKQKSAKIAVQAWFQGIAAASNFAGGTHGFAGSTAPGNLVGFGFGARASRDMGLTGEDVVRVYVAALSSKSSDPPAPVIPPSFAGLATDVVEVGDVSAAVASMPTGSRFSRGRPASCGVSVGHPSVTAGTLGCRVKKNGTLYILSNNHVLANCNAGPLGCDITQPGFLDGGRTPTDNIATLTDFETLDFTGGANDFDAAIAQIATALAPAAPDVEFDIIDIGSPGTSPKAAALYQSVRKHGRTTGHTVGVVVDVSVSLWVGYGLQKAWFQDQVAIQGVGAAHFSNGGDSGSLIVDAVSLEPVALLFAGSTSGLTFGNPIQPVLTRFGVTIG